MKTTCLFAVCLTLLAGAKPLYSQTGYGIPTDQSWRKMSVREKIGQLVIANFKDSLFRYGDPQRLLQRYPVGSVFLSRVPAPERSEKVSAMVRHSKYPLLLVGDNEAGAGNNFDELTQFTNLMGLGATRSAELAYDFAKATALESRSIGIRWIFSPVIDLNQNPFNPVVNTRALGEDPDAVYRLSSAYIRGLQQNGVGGCAKHFPGDGVDYRDQHMTTSMNFLSRSQWFANHGKLFRKSIDDGVYTIMAGHLSLPFYQRQKLEGFYPPATLSAELLQGLLRKKLKFKGVIVSDALIMGGFIKWYHNRAEREVACFKAGCDMLLWPEVPSFFAAMEQKLASGEISMEQLDSSVARIWWLKEKLGLLSPAPDPVLGDADRNFIREVNRRVAEQSLTLQNDRLGQLPLRAANLRKVLLVQVSPQQQSRLFTPLLEALRRRGIQVDTARNNYKSGFNASRYDLLIYAVSRTMHKPIGFLDFQGAEAEGGIWNALSEAREKTVVVSFGSPYFFREYFERANVYIDAYSNAPAVQSAVDRALFGEIPLKGKSPVSDLRNR